jgi:hypothetical protein
MADFVVNERELAFIPAGTAGDDILARYNSSVVPAP